MQSQYPNDNSRANNSNANRANSAQQTNMVQDIIGSLYPINTQNQQHNSYMMQHHQWNVSDMGNSHHQNGLQTPHLWSADLLSLHSPTNYEEIFQHLSAPTPVGNNRTNQAGGNNVNNNNNNTNIPSTIYINPLVNQSNDSDDLLTCPSFPPDGLKNANVAKLLLDKNKKVSDATTYGPRFCEIFHSYCHDHQLNLNTKRHLMVLCCENLVNFICWARDTEDRVRWMSKLLLENDYLRPEVRNGIVMVVIYTFASIKASQSGGDMFTTLQDTEEGLGIANRFSLKIYNDPYGYLSFLKFSISSLIDAGAIPENERLNKPFKKGTSKPLPMNRNEIECFHKLKTRLVELLDKKMHNEARAYVQTITTHWQFRGNALRTKRFSSALEIVNQPHGGLVDIAALVYNEKMQLAREGKLVEEPVTTLADIKNMGKESSASKAGKEKKKHGLSQSDEGAGMGGNSVDSSSNKRPRYEENGSNKDLVVLGDNTVLPPHSTSLEPITRQADPKISSISAADAYSSASDLSLPEGNANNAQIANTALKVFTNPIPGAPYLSLQRPFSFKAIRFERIGLNEWKMKETIIFDIQKFIESLVHLQLTGSSQTNPTSMITPLQDQPEFHLYLLNEKPLISSLQDGYLRVHHASSTPRIGKPNSGPSIASQGGLISGIISLEHELKKLSCITTSWQLNEVSQFQQFLLAYYQQYALGHPPGHPTVTSSRLSSPSGIGSVTGGSRSPSVTLHQFWHQFDPEHSSHPASTNNGSSLNTESSMNPLTPLSSVGPMIVGCIGYEITSSMILVVRENKTLGISSDIWCKLYPNDFSHAMEELLYPMQQKQHQQKSGTETMDGEDMTGSNTAKISFGDILLYFFPQLSMLTRRLAIASQQISQQKGFNIQFTYDDVFIKYCPNTASTDYHSPSLPHPNSSGSVGSGEDPGSIGIPLARSESRDVSNPISKASINSLLPPKGNASSYQTIGLFTTPAKKILARLQSGAKIHDFILEIETDL